MNTENIAYEKRYQDWRSQYDIMFAPENRLPQQDEQFPLVNGYSVHSKAYFYDDNLHLNGSENELLDKDGNVSYIWRMVSHRQPPESAERVCPERTGVPVEAVC